MHVKRGGITAEWRSRARWRKRPGSWAIKDKGGGVRGKGGYRGGTAGHCV